MWAAAQMAEVHRVHLGSICINAPASAKLAASLELWSFNMKYRHPIGIFFCIQYSALCVTSNETNTEIKWLISNKIKPFKSTSYIWSSEGFIQCKISLCWFLYYLYCSLCRVPALYMKIDLGTQRITGLGGRSSIAPRKDWLYVSHFWLPVMDNLPSQFFSFFLSLESSSPYLSKVCYEAI